MAFEELTNAIKKEWGGKPFTDLQKGWKYILEQYPEIDTDRAVAAGASYGGYAIKFVAWFHKFREGNTDVFVAGFRDTPSSDSTSRL